MDSSFLFVPKDSDCLRLLVELTSIWVLHLRIGLCVSLWIRFQCPFLAFCSWRLHVIDPIFIVLDQLVYCFLQQNSGDWLTQFPSSRLDNPKCDANFVGLFFARFAGHGCGLAKLWTGKLVASLVSYSKLAYRLLTST
jgi:hypothetical protein